MKLPRIPVNMQVYPQMPLSLPNEPMLVFTRVHWFMPVLSSVILCLISLFVLFLSAVVLLYVYPFPALFVIFSALVVSLTMTAALNIYIEWYSHFYIITTKRIAEYYYIPLFTNYVNEVLLERVKCTELDVDSGGIIKRLFDIGNVSITFDRPTHIEAFVFSNIHKPNEVGELLTNYFSTRTDKETTIWRETSPESQRRKSFYPIEDIQTGLLS
jgi:hypothetical protein